MAEHHQVMKYRLDETAKYRMRQPALGSDDAVPGRRPKESLALHPAIGLLVAVGASTLFWTVVIWLIVWWVR